MFTPYYHHKSYCNITGLIITCKYFGCWILFITHNNQSFIFMVFITDSLIINCTIYFVYHLADRGEYGHLNGKKDKNENDIKKMAEMKANMQLSEGESSTIMALHEYCKNEVSQGRSSYIYYIHSKGGCCVRGMNICCLYTRNSLIKNKHTRFFYLSCCILYYQCQKFIQYNYFI